MSYFDSQNGWIQFVFANEQDTYYLPSMVRVNFQRYLFYCLKKAGYEAVYFWNESDGKPELGYLDGTSAQYYEKVRPQKLLGKLFGGWDNVPEQNGNEWNFVRMANESTMEQLFYQIAEGKKKAAIVVPMAVFDEFFSKSERASILIERNKRQKSFRNLVLITASVRAEDSNRYLTSKDGILGRLFAEVRQAATSDTCMNIYESIQINMGEKCLFLNNLNRGMVRNLIWKRFVFDRQDDTCVSNNMLEQMTDVIVSYYHSDTFRRETPIVLPENRKRELSVIDKSLQNPRTCSVICDWIEQTEEWQSAEKFRAFLKETYPQERSKTYIYTDSFLIRQWEQIVLPESSITVEQRSWRQRLDMLYMTLKALVLRGDESTDREKLDACTEQIKKSLNNKDMRTFQYGLKAMQYLLDTYYEEQPSKGDVWKFYRKIFELSEEVQKLGKEITENKRQMSDSRIEMYRLFDQISALEKQPDRDEDGGELDVLRQQALQCDEDITLLNGILTIKNNQRFQYRQAIASMEQAIQGTAGGTVVDVQEVLKEAMDMQQKILHQSYQTIKDINQVKEKNPSAVERLTGQNLAESEDLEERYRALANKMNNLR